MPGVIGDDARVGHLLLLGRQPPHFRRRTEQEEARGAREDRQATQILRRPLDSANSTACARARARCNVLGFLTGKRKIGPPCHQGNSRRTCSARAGTRDRGGPATTQSRTGSGWR